MLIYYWLHKENGEKSVMKRKRHHNQSLFMIFWVPEDLEFQRHHPSPKIIANSWPLRIGMDDFLDLRTTSVCSVGIKNTKVLFDKMSDTTFCISNNSNKIQLKLHCLVLSVVITVLLKMIKLLLLIIKRSIGGRTTPWFVYLKKILTAHVYNKCLYDNGIILKWMK